MPLTLAERMVDGSVRLVADWPLSGPGHYRLRFELDRLLVEEANWTVTPSKLSTDAFHDLLEDLENRLPVSLALALQKLGAVTGMELDCPAEGSSIAEEIARLRRAVMRTDAGPGLAEILIEISRDPHEVLADTEVWVPSVRARRVTPSGLIQATYPSSNRGSDGIPERLPDARVEPSVDVYENRLLKSFADQVQHRIRRLLSFLSSKNEPELFADVESMGKAMRSARLQAKFLDSVSALEQPPTRVSMVLVKKPAYRRLFESFLDFRRRTRVRLEDSALEAPLEQLPELYEKWGTLVAIHAVLQLGEELGYVVVKQRLFGQGPSGPWIEVLPDGRSALDLCHPESGIKVSVIPQKSYSPNAVPLRSISFRQIPDIAIEVESPGGARSVYLLDPKYKLESEDADPSVIDGKPKKADIDKMHAYRDAIRDSQGNRVVQLAAILYPGQSKTFGDGLAALAAIPGAENALLDEIKSSIRPALLA